MVRAYYRAKRVTVSLVDLRREIGGRQGIRTPGLLVANEALSQLS